MSTQVSAPHKVASSAIITISSSAWRWALPERGSSSSAKHARNRSMPSPFGNQDGKIRSIFPRKKNLQIPYAIPLPSYP
jgi:hypothetical protein